MTLKSYDAKIRELRAAEWSLRRIAREIGCSQVAIWKYLKRNGLNSGKTYGHGPCEICGLDSTLDADHNHITNQQRGLLCRSCNQMLGNAKDSTQTLHSAVQYLEKYNGIITGSQ
jgi:hypothetical protein